MHRKPKESYEAFLGLKMPSPQEKQTLTTMRDENDSQTSVLPSETQKQSQKRRCQNHAAKKGREKKAREKAGRVKGKRGPVPETVSMTDNKPLQAPQAKQMQQNTTWWDFDDAAFSCGSDQIVSYFCTFNTRKAAAADLAVDAPHNNNDESDERR